MLTSTCQDSPPWTWKASSSSAYQSSLCQRGWPPKGPKELTGTQNETETDTDPSSLAHSRWQDMDPEGKTYKTAESTWKKNFFLKSNCQSIVIKLMNFPTLLITTQNSNSLNQMSWYWCKKVKSCKKKIKSCLGAIVGHPPKNALYHTMQMVLVEPCDKLIICFLWVLKGGKHNYWWHMASIIMFTTF